MITLTIAPTTTTAQTCAAPTALQLVSHDETTAEIEWSADTTALAFEVMYRIRYTTYQQTHALHVPEILLTHFFPCTEYEIRVRSHCDSLGSSGWSTALYFTTDSAAGCPNRIPHAYDDVVVLASATSTGIYPLTNDVDPDCDSMYFDPAPVLIQGLGTLSWAADSLIYTPTSLTDPVAVIRYRIHDGTAASNFATVYVVMAPPFHLRHSEALPPVTWCAMASLNFTLKPSIPTPSM